MIGQQQSDVRSLLTKSFPALQLPDVSESSLTPLVPQSNWWQLDESTLRPHRPTIRPSAVLNEYGQYVGLASMGATPDPNTGKLVEVSPILMASGSRSVGALARWKVRRKKVAQKGAAPQAQSTSAIPHSHALPSGRP